jgi:hypothetical protein
LREKNRGEKLFNLHVRPPLEMIAGNIKKRIMNEEIRAFFLMLKIYAVLQYM